MNLKPMTSIARTRSEFERNFNILAEKMRYSRISIARGVKTDGIERVRYLPNKRIDFLSVNESARLMANIFADMENLPEFKIDRDSNSDE